MLKGFFSLFFWFLWTGSANVIPHLYFLETIPEQKELWLSLLILMSTTASLIGVYLTRCKVFTNLVVSRLSILTALFVTLFLFTGLFLHPSISLYFLLYLSFRLVGNFTYQKLDLYLITELKSEQLQAYSASNVLYMFIGTILGPLFFAYYYSVVEVLPVVILFALVSFFGLYQYLSPSNKGTFKAATHFSRKNDTFNLSAIDKSFCLYGLTYLAIIYLTSLLLVYFIRDYYHYNSPAKAAGWVMLVTSSVGFISAGFYGKFRIISSDLKYFSLHAGIIGFTLLALMLLYLQLSYSLWYLCVCTAIMGVSYGIYMTMGRYYVYSVDKDKKNGILSLYNMTPHLSTLMVFLIAALCAWLLGDQLQQYYYSLLVILVILSLSALFFAKQFTDRLQSGVV